MDLLAVFNPVSGEGLVVLLVVLLLFGAKRLPEIGKGLGKGIKEFRGAAKGLTDDDDEPAAKPAPKPGVKPADQQPTDE